MTQQLRAAGALTAATGAFLVLGVPLMILLVLDPSSQAACGGAPTGPGPVERAWNPAEPAADLRGRRPAVQLGNDGWAYLAAFNDAESGSVPTTAPGPGCCRATRPARPGRCRSGSAARRRDNWDTVVARDPAGPPGGAQPPSVYNEVDAVYGAAALLKKWGAPANWQAALVAWNNYPPEIAQVTQLVAQYTQTGQAQQRRARGRRRRPRPVPARRPGMRRRSAGRRRPGAVATILPNGLAAIPQGAPPAVQEMIAAGNQIIHYPYSYGGGHSPASMRVPPGPGRRSRRAGERRARL